MDSVSYGIRMKISLRGIILFRDGLGNTLERFLEKTLERPTFQVLKCDVKM